MVPADTGSLRTGEFARRVGVGPGLLRVWERRYGLLHPVPLDGGFRLYTPADAERVTHMRRALDAGLSAAEAARTGLAEGRPAGNRGGRLTSDKRAASDPAHGDDRLRRGASWGSAREDTERYVAAWAAGAVPESASGGQATAVGARAASAA